MIPALTGPLLLLSEEGIGQALPLWTVLPFALLLLCIAVLPLCAGHWWEHNRNKALVAGLLSAPIALYLVTLGCTVAGCTLLARLLHAPLGLALRAGRDSAVRSAAIGIDVPRLQWLAFVIAGSIAGLAGALFAFAKGTISPETLGVAKSVDGLVMVLLGGVQTLSGPWAGAALFTWLQDTVMRQTDYWRALLGATMLALVLLFPLGVAGGLRRIFLKEPV